MSKILVTGGAGFIASQIVDALVLEGHSVAVVDDLSSGLREYINPQAKFYELDINSPELPQVFSDFQPEYVYHLAAQIDVRKSVENPELDNRINVLGGLKVLENCLKHQVKKIIFSSTGGALYGEAKIIPTAEDYPTDPLSPYGINKLTFEKYLYYYNQVFGQNYTILRLANVYGPRQYKGGEAGVIAIFTDQAIAGQPSRLYGDGLQTRDYVFVSDVVRAFILAMKTEYVGAINIGTSRESSLLDVISEIEAALGHSLEVIKEPAKPGECRRSALAFKRAQEVLGWEPQVFLPEGIALTVAWSKGRKSSSVG
ncbi:MAG TPA: NAD-dependent epimerase/dehydratase family protein [bacterium]|nr:NAD-dependent epimerase/dehydratase family protein [bacterium]HPT30166.1 NAD-dependent epimerase/dehydratase family protein [bacterium]